MIRWRNETPALNLQFGPIGAPVVENLPVFELLLQLPADHNDKRSATSEPSIGHLWADGDLSRDGLDLGAHKRSCRGRVAHRLAFSLLRDRRCAAHSRNIDLEVIRRRLRRAGFPRTGIRLPTAWGS